jgi:hypothetical protein
MALITCSAYGELFEKKLKRIKANSPFGMQPRWNLQHLIVKSGEEVLQEEVNDSLH